jgi:hypothetical protein
VCFSGRKAGVSVDALWYEVGSVWRGAVLTCVVFTVRAAVDCGRGIGGARAGVGHDGGRHGDLGGVGRCGSGCFSGVWANERAETELYCRRERAGGRTRSWMRRDGLSEEDEGLWGLRPIYSLREAK